MSAPGLGAVRPGLPPHPRCLAPRPCCGTARRAPPPPTGFQHQQVQRVVLQVGGGGDLVRGDAQDELLVVTPGEQQAARRQAQDAVLLCGGLQRQLLQLLRGGAGLLSPGGRLGRETEKGARVLPSPALPEPHPGLVQQLQELVTAGGVQRRRHPGEVAQELGEKWVREGHRVTLERWRTLASD